MKERISRVVCSVVLVVVGQAIGSEVFAAPVSPKQTAIGAKACDTQSWQSPPKTPKPVSTALMGLGLVAVGAAARRGTLKRS